MSTPHTSAPSLASGNAVVPSPHPTSKTLSPLVIPSPLTSASPLSLILSAIRVKSPFSHSALFGFIGSLPLIAIELHDTRLRRPPQALHRSFSAVWLHRLVKLDDCLIHRHVPAEVTNLFFQAFG